MLHTVLIVCHAIAGGACLAAGLVYIPLRTPGSWRFRARAGSLLAMLAFAAGSVTAGWAHLDVAAKLIFTGLIGLGLYMVWRADRAWTRLRRQGRGWQPKYVDDVGSPSLVCRSGWWCWQQWAVSRPASTP